MPQFEYLDDLSHLDPTALVVRIPRGIRSKEKLFSVYARRLSFPGYFGWNWDAFEECLGDRSWFDAARPVVIVHEDVPFCDGGPLRGVYLAVLRDSPSKIGSSEQGSLQIVFPRSFQATVDTVLR